MAESQTTTEPTPPDRIWMRAEVLASPELREHFVKLNSNDIEYARVSASVAPGVANLEAWTSIDVWLRDNPNATAAECLAELVKRIKVESAPASTVAPQEQSDASITGEGRLIIKLLLDWRKSYSEDIFAPWTIEEAQAVHAQFPGVVDRISADSARSIINRIIGDIQAGKHKTWEDSTTNRYDAIYVSTAFVSPVATQDMASTARKVAEGEDTK